MWLSAKINVYGINGSEAEQKVTFQGTGPFARSESDLSAGANTAVALAGLTDFPVRAISSTCCSHYVASQEPDRESPGNTPNTSVVAHDPVSPISVERMQAAPDYPTTLLAMQRPLTRPLCLKLPLFDFIAGYQFGGGWGKLVESGSYTRNLLKVMA
jgi:hypothetical protein